MLWPRIAAYPLEKETPMPLNESIPPVIAIVGATGAVGREMLAVLEQRRFPHREIRLLASTRSAGTTLPFAGRHLPVMELTEDSFDGVDIALFSAGGNVSKQFAPIAAQRGVMVIDNSSAFRMNEDVPLVVPEINDDVLDDLDTSGGAIIANPNCSTIIALMAVTPIYDAVGVDRMVISTYQAASGAGAAAMEELERQAHDYAAGRELTSPIFGRPYLFNLFSHNSPIDEDGYNQEETKMVHETQKIWGDDSVGITATCVRVPVLRAHCESINLSLRKPLSEDEAREILENAPGVRVVDDRRQNRFPEPIDASGIDEVLVGRIRSDYSQPPGYGLNLFVAGDQLRKGAALNAVQIAEALLERRSVTV
jgi:aspartate-semialdehyde dehydrogenase